MNRVVMKKQILEKVRMLSNVMLPSGREPMSDGLDLHRQNSSSSQQCGTVHQHTGNGQRMQRKEKRAKKAAGTRR